MAKPKPRSNKRWLSVREVIDKEGFARSTVYKAIWHDKIPAKLVKTPERNVKIGWLVDTWSDVYLDWVDEVRRFKEVSKGYLERAHLSTQERWREHRLKKGGE